MINIKTLLATKKNLFKAGIILIGLAIFDTISTDYGLRFDHIQEANPLMKFVYESGIPNFYVLKISLPLLLLYLITQLKPKIHLQLLMGVTLLLYSGIVLLHIFWMSLV